MRPMALPMVLVGDAVDRLLDGAVIEVERKAKKKRKGKVLSAETSIG